MFQKLLSVAVLSAAFCLTLGTSDAEARGCRSRWRGSACCQPACCPSTCCDSGHFGSGHFGYGHSGYGSWSSGGYASSNCCSNNYVTHSYSDHYQPAMNYGDTGYGHMDHDYQPYTVASSCGCH